jgi:glycosyltransferase involved in cell wall biosynthesis
MKVLMLSKALVTGAYQRKLEELAAIDDVDLTVIVAPYWQEANAGRLNLEKKYLRGYRLLVEPMFFNGHHHMHFYPNLGRHIAQIHPDIFHIDEEAFNLATFHAMWLGVRTGCRNIFYTWANIYRKVPPPFSIFERYNFGHAAAAMAGNLEAAEILRLKGFEKEIDVIPQFGVDTDIFRPAGGKRPGDGMVIGYLGRLVEPKGVQTLIAALAKLPADCVLKIVGDGVTREALEKQAAYFGVRDRVTFVPQVPSGQVPDMLNSFDVLVLPSLTTPTWKEQFGRVLIEAMACSVPVVGSDSGEIPNVIGAAGFVFHEGNAEALADRLATLAGNRDFRMALGEQGRRRVIDFFTQKAVAKQHYELYRRVLERD